MSPPSIHSSASPSASDRTATHHKHQQTSASPPPTLRSLQASLKMDSSPSWMLCRGTATLGKKVDSTTHQLTPTATCSWSTPTMQVASSIEPPSVAWLSAASTTGQPIWRTLSRKMLTFCDQMSRFKCEQRQAMLCCNKRAPDLSPRQRRCSGNSTGWSLWLRAHRWC